MTNGKILCLNLNRRDPAERFRGGSQLIALGGDWRKERSDQYRPAWFDKLHCDLLVRFSEQWN
jgi:hypothetical protein